MRPLPAATVLVAAPAAPAARPDPHLRPDDLYALKAVADPQLSPDGQWVAYTVTRSTPRKTKAIRDVYMVPVRRRRARAAHLGREARVGPALQPRRAVPRVPGGARRQTHPGLPDGPHAGRGGEAHGLPGAASPTSPGRRTARAWRSSSPTPIRTIPTFGRGGGRGGVAQPIVIRRRQFKRDGEGYLTDVRSHLYVFDVARKTSLQLTSGAYDDSSPAWSPDGQHARLREQPHGGPGLQPEHRRLRRAVHRRRAAAARRVPGRGRRRPCSAPTAR